MIIWGSKGVTKTVNTGSFHCPDCRGAREYQHQEVLRCFTLYFIPLFETEKLGEYVECGACHGKYEMVVLQHDPKKLEAEFRRSFDRLLLHVVAVMLGGDGPAAPPLDAVRDSYKRATGREIEDAELRAELIHPNSLPPRVLEAARKLAENLNERGKEALVRTAIGVSADNGGIDAGKQHFIFDLCKAVGVTSSHLKGILADFGYSLDPR